MTLDMFSENVFSQQDDSYPIEIPDGELRVFPQLFSLSQADEYFHTLMDEVVWKNERISLYGRTYDVPRLSAWYADAGKSYEYSGIRVDGIPWTPLLSLIKAHVELKTGEIFNSVLVNQYRNGADGVAWHSDDEPELGEDPIIASVSFGEERLFQLKHKRDSTLKRSFTLPHGSLLLMGKQTQLNWMHQIPKSQRQIGPRINLTFRQVN